MKKPIRLLAAVSMLLAMGLLSACSGSNKKPQPASTDSTPPAVSAPKSPIAVPLPDHIKSKGVLRIGVKCDYPPFGMIDSAGKKVGFEIDMAHQMAEWAFGDPSKVEFECVTGANRIPLLQSEKIDLILATMGVTEERAKVVDFSQKYFTSGVMLMVPKESTIKDVQDLKGKKVITIKGTTGSQGLEKLVPDAEQIKLDKTSDAIKALADGRGVAFAQDDVLLFQLVKENAQYKVAGKPFNQTDWAMAVRKGDSGFKAWVDAAIDEFKKRDLFMQYFDKWVKVEGLPVDPKEFVLRP